MPGEVRGGGQSISGPGPQTVLGTARPVPPGGPHPAAAMGAGREHLPEGNPGTPGQGRAAPETNPGMAPRLLWGKGEHTPTPPVRRCEGAASGSAQFSGGAGTAGAAVPAPAEAAGSPRAQAGVGREQPLPFSVNCGWWARENHPGFNLQKVAGGGHPAGREDGKTLDWWIGKSFRSSADRQPAVAAGSWGDLSEEKTPPQPKERQMFCAGRKACGEGRNWEFGWQRERLKGTRGCSRQLREAAALQGLTCLCFLSLPCSQMPPVPPPFCHFPAAKCHLCHRQSPSGDSEHTLGPLRPQDPSVPLLLCSGFSPASVRGMADRYPGGDEI